MSETVFDEHTGIVYRRWAAAEPRAALLLVHGLGSYGGRWSFLAEFLLKEGISSYAIDLRGFGETPGLKGHVGSLGVYYEDIKSLRGIIIKDCPGRKIFLCGESMGGLISFTAACLAPGLFDGLICLAPSFRNRLKVKYTDYLRMFFFRVFAPRKQMLLPFTAQMCTRDSAYQQVMESDKREIKVATPVLLTNILLAEARAGALSGKLSCPVLFQVPLDMDNFVDPEGTRNIFRALRVPDKKIIFYPLMLHSLSVDMGREEVFNDILDWLNGRIK